MLKGVLTTLLLIGRLSAQKWIMELISSAMITKERSPTDRTTSAREILRLSIKRTVQSREEECRLGDKDMLVEKRKKREKNVR